ncbi:MAG: DUF3108 domain-containing protein [Hyphomonadaceae bacterium]|nr:DUF3108 domain-containing protein [Hyphomonadaceae bacterium]MBX3509624.1 DUF3108 domain-containing protein [Hyphomonadaceae bacterium]
MKKIVAALFGIGLAALAGSAAAQGQGASRQFHGTYAVYARGIQAGEFTYRFSQTDAAYEASASRRLSGLARTLMGDRQDYDYSVRGAVAANGALQPAAYTHRGGRRDRVVRTTFSATDAVTTAEPAMGMGNPPATQAQRRGSVDQITAIASMITASGDPCRRTIPVYMDGRSRFDFVLTPNGQVNVNTPAYRGQALRCRVEFRPIAGFSDPQTTETLSFLFARTASGLYAPIVIEMPTDDVGVARLEARRLTINGERLR